MTTREFIVVFGCIEMFIILSLLAQHEKEMRSIENVVRNTERLRKESLRDVGIGFILANIFIYLVYFALINFGNNDGVIWFKKIWELTK